MKKVAGLLAFAVALVGAILLTQYYSRRYAPPKPPTPPPPAAAPAAPGSAYTDARGNAPVTFKTRLVTLDLAAKKGHLTLALERDPARPAPPSVWVWAYFFSTDARGNTPVSFKLHLATLDPAAGAASLALTLEHEAARPAPADVWVWAYFFSPDAPGRYCAAEPLKLSAPFSSVTSHNNTDNVTLNLSVTDCPAPRGPSSTYYARVNVSTESAFASRLAEQRISYDITQASPVVLKGKK